MTHPDEGVLRRLLDDPAAIPEAERAHVAACDDCDRSIGAMRQDADAVHAALATDVDVDLDAAWRRLTGAAGDSSTSSTSGGATVTPLRAVAPRPANRVRAALRRPAVAGIAVAVILTGAGTAAANDWFQIFRTERIEVVRFSPDTLLNALPDLAAYGDVVVDGTPDVRPVSSAADAEATTGLAVPVVAELPRGVTGEPRYRVGDEVSVTFTYDAELAGDASSALDGSTVRLVAGPGVAATWSDGTGVPLLLVGRASAPTAHASADVSFEAIRDHLLSMPGLPDDVAASLRSFNADGGTFPLPIPAEHVESTTADVNGAEATVVTTRDGTLAAVAWVDDGVVTVVGGALGVDEVLEIARELR